MILGAGQPIVLVAVDWCEIRNEAYDRWQTVLAQAAKTTTDRVLVSSIHQHDAPVADLEAQRLLTTNHSQGSICDVQFHEQAVQRVAQALKTSLQKPRRFTEIGLGQAKVEQVASNRRYVDADGTIKFNRTSATRDPSIREKSEGTIDPWLKTLSFWNDGEPVAALSCYATHPMSYYGQGGVSSDFVGMARHRRLKDDPKVAQIYASGCSGNVTAGKYNDGSPANRPILADRMYQAMVAAWKATQRHSLKQAPQFRTVPLRLEPRNDAGFTVEDLNHRLKDKHSKPFDQCLAALGLSWRRRADTGRALTVPVLDFGIAQLLLMPGESYVEYQLVAQKMRPGSFVMMIGYGESATGYVPTDKALQEGDTNLRDWCWVGPGAEKAITTALEGALKPKRSG
ncbi:MAG: hypothetical protein L0387_14245 [Acidobacteria bacterium]|nr:hypothetical protein [Acidobacteriota bacterium]MCI0719436.1 hypothetical protein [Acidobacteriota bacterium]